MYGSIDTKNAITNPKSTYNWFLPCNLFIGLLFFIYLVSPTIFISDKILSNIHQQTVYVASYSNDVSIIDINNNEIYSYIVGDRPSCLNINPLNPSIIYVVNELGSTVYGVLYTIKMNKNDLYIMDDITSQTLPGYNPSSLTTSPNDDYLAITHFEDGGGLALYSLNDNGDAQLILFHKFASKSQLHSVKFIDDETMIITDWGLDLIYLMTIDADNNELILIDEYGFDDDYSDNIGPRSIGIHSLYNNMVVVSLQDANGVALFEVTNAITLIDIKYFNDCSEISDVRIIDNFIGVGCRKCGLYSNTNGCIALLKLNIDASAVHMDMSLLAYIDSGGETPRSFDFILYDNDLNELKMVIGNQDSNNVMLKTIYLSQSNVGNMLTSDDNVFDIDSPAYILYQ